jgi:hypothetical protein
MREELIAPCGMNCNICASYLAVTHDVRGKGIRMAYCRGCRPRNKACSFLRKRCDLLLENRVEYCFECDGFPCEHLSAIDKRYRTHFRMSEIQNLERIRGEGISNFLEAERFRWRCPGCGGVVCCHNGICFDCGLDELRQKKRLYRWSAPDGHATPSEGHREHREPCGKGEVDRAVAQAKRLLSEHGHECQATAEDMVLWFQADTPYDEDFGLDKVIRKPLVVVHELVEIDNVKRMGIALARNAIVDNMEKVDDAHLKAAKVELQIAASMRDVGHLRWRSEHIRMWSEDPSVAPSNRERYKRMLVKVAKTIEELEGSEIR